MPSTDNTGEPRANQGATAQQQGLAQAPARSGRSGDGLVSVIPAMQEQERERQRQHEQPR